MNSTNSTPKIRGYFWLEEMGTRGKPMSEHTCNSICEPGNLKHFIPVYLNERKRLKG